VIIKSGEGGETLSSHTLRGMDRQMWGKRKTTLQNKEKYGVRSPEVEKEEGGPKCRSMGVGGLGYNHGKTLREFVNPDPMRENRRRRLKKGIWKMHKRKNPETNHLEAWLGSC